MARTYDYIIVGGGSAGCIAAFRIVRERGARVLLLERGPAKAGILTRFLLKMPAGWIRNIGRSPIIEMHTPIPQKHLGGRAPAVGQAAILGGGSAVNAMVYTRGQKADYDDWDTFLGGGSGWSFADLLPHFRAMEHNHRFSDCWHGDDGPQHVSDVGYTCRLTEDYILAVQNLGVSFNPDFNGVSQYGVGTMQYTTWRNRRHDAVQAFLEPLAKDDRLTVRTNVLVARITFQNHRATGVTVIADGRTETIHTEGEVLVAAGTYNTPKLLMLSGIGPSGRLAGHGIETVVDLPGVGENLQDHHEVPVVATTTSHVGYHGEDRGVKAIRNGLQYLLFRTGPVASVGVEACAYVDPDNATDSSRRPRIKMYCIPAVYVDKDITGVEPQDGVTLNACLLRPASRGTVRLRSANPTDKPIVDNNYLAEPEDLRLEIAGLRFAMEILRAQPLATHVGEVLLPGCNIDDDIAIAAHCRRTVKTNWHPVGTCKMGPAGDAMAVLDDRLRVRGVEGLRVMDASAMPFIPSGNTNAPTMALSDRGVALMD
jgi:choline dehydrogenase-like flavoprotein